MKKNSSRVSRFTFKKEERLSKKKLLTELFRDGSSFHLPPFRILYLQKDFDAPFPAQVLITASSKNFPQAVDRNRIRRLTRESYRLNKQILYQSLKEKELKLLVAFIYTGRKVESFELIEEKMISILKRLSDNHAAVEKNNR